MGWYVSERTVEVPWILERARGPMLLDVGKDSTGWYTRDLESKGFVVESVDPHNKGAYYKTRFERLDVGEKQYNTVLFLSSLEHFDFSHQNLAMASMDIYCICKARAMLAPSGVIIVTVPFGKLSMPGDFVQWDAERVGRVIQYSGVRVLEQRVMLRNDDDEWEDDDEWSEVSMHDCGDVLYRDDGLGANAVYMGVWW